MKLYYVSLGCPKNSIDLEIILGGLPANAEITTDPDEADAVVVNTCAFIAPAKTESIETILEIARYKEKNSRLKLLVTGCLPQRYREELAEALPEVDAFFCNADVEKTRQEVRSFLQATGSDQERRRLGPGHFAYLRIADGCDNRCHYCAIPVIKGAFRSRPATEIVAEARHLAGDRTVELLLVAQDTTSYGHDFGQPQSLHRLLYSLHEIEAIRWIRLLYTHPAHWYPSLIETVAGLDKVVKYIDLPIQHIADPVLSRMGRRTSRRQIVELIEALRKGIPDLALRTSLIVGHPGESEKEFSELIRFVEEIQFERLGVFTYSQEEGTRSADWPDEIPEEKKIARQEEVMTRQADISCARNQRLVGRDLTILIDEYDEERDSSSGRTQWDAPEIDNSVQLPGRLSPGEFVRARITAADIYDLAAVLI